MFFIIVNNYSTLPHVVRGVGGADHLACPEFINIVLRPHPDEIGNHHKVAIVPHGLMK